MNVSFSWLSEYVPHGLTAEGVADLLTMAGLEVESVERTGPSFSGVVVGHVLETRPHPAADRLTCCVVDVGAEAPVAIVCGAPNVAAGQKVAVATVGTTLCLPARETPGQAAPVTIKRARIRGEVSEGMICAEDELGLGDDHAGILVLGEDAVPGTPFADYLAARGALPGDAVLDVNITPNRPDATSHIGIARDVAALTGVPLTLPDVAEPAAGGAAAEAVAVHIEDAADCPRYCAVLVRGVRVGESPAWLRERLAAIGVRSVSNVVDVTNFVLHEAGQPLHAFDLARLEGAPGREATIHVRRSRPGERLTTLDGAERTLPEGTLVIADAARPVAVAGVMGGADTEVTGATTDILIESAVFEAAAVRRAARALGLHTDAAYRFERGVDPTAQPRAAARAAALIAEIAGGTVVEGMAEAHPRPHEPRTVTLRPERLAATLGADVPPEDVARLLTAIGFEVSRADALDAFAEGALAGGTLEAAAAGAAHGGWRVTVPPFRPDVAREIDVVEEVARLYGFDRLPLPATTAVPLVPSGDTPAAHLLAQARRTLAALGFHELFANSLVPAPVAARFADPAWTGGPAAPVETLNPISQEMAALRPALLPGLLAAAAYTAARGADGLRFFEAGRVFARGAGAEEPVPGYREHTALAIGLGGPARRASWDGPARAADFYDLKGIVQHLLAGVGVPTPRETPHPEPSALAAYALELHAGERRLGTLARVADDVCADYDLPAPFFAAELDWDAVAAAARSGVVRYAPISRFPVAERDLAVVVDAAQPAGPLAETIREAGGALLRSVRLFDVYTGERLPPGRKSLAFALRFGAERTLRDKEVEGRMKAILRALEHVHGAVLRT
ncbi:MAG: phenylalanine--tRNA ligase subunit beta [Rubricoccaceae bacterium]